MNNLPAPSTLKEAKAVIAAAPDWLTSHNPTVNEVKEYLAWLTTVADATLWVTFSENPGEIERGTEQWAALVADEMLRYLRNIDTISDSARSVLISEMQKRRLFEHVFGNYNDLAQAISERAPHLSRSKQSELLSIAEVIAPWCEQHEKDGAPAAEELWHPGAWERMRPAIPLMKAVIKGQNGQPADKVAEELHRIVKVFTSDEHNIHDLRQMLALNPSPQIEYQVEKADSATDELLFRITFPHVSKVEMDTVLGRLGARAKPIDPF